MSRRGRPIFYDGRLVADAIRTGAIQPFRQGDLDSLCGLYSVLNAARLLCPELDLERSQSLFTVLGQTLDKERITAHETVSLGIEIPTIRALVKSACDYFRDIHQVRLVAEPLKLSVGSPTIDLLWVTLTEQVNGGRVAILGLSGKHDHWTVVHRATRRTLWLFDSDQLKVLTRSRCSIRSVRFPYQIDPEEIILLRRVVVRS